MPQRSATQSPAPEKAQEIPSKYVPLLTCLTESGVLNAEQGLGKNIGDNVPGGAAGKRVGGVVSGVTKG